MFIIRDAIHCEYNMAAGYPTFELALAELRRLSAIPWDVERNLAPCMSWETCGREYSIDEYADSAPDGPWVKSTPVLEIDAKGVRWEVGLGPVDE